MSVKKREINISGHLLKTLPLCCLYHYIKAIKIFTRFFPQLVIFEIRHALCIIFILCLLEKYILKFHLFFIRKILQNS